MKISLIKSLALGFCLLALAIACASGAEEEVTTTTTSSSSTEATSTSSQPTGNAGPTGTGIFSGAPAPSGAVTGSANAAPTVERNPTGGGGFAPTPLKLYATLSGGYDDNVNTVHTGKQSSAFTNGNAILDYSFGDPRLQLVLNGGAGLTYYFSHVNNHDYDIDLKGALGITYKASPRLTLGSTLLVDYLSEPSFEYAGGINSRNGNYLFTTDKAFLQYAWSGRFATKTSYTFEAFNYEENTVGVFSNRVSNLFGNEFRFQWLPTTILVAEYRYGIVSYENSFLDSTTHYALAGVDHTFNPRLVGTFRGGAQFRSFDNDGDRSGPYFEGNVNYALGRRTSVSWISRYGIEEPDTPGEQSRTTFRTGLQTKFNLTSRISTGVDLYYVRDDYHSLTTGLITNPPFAENTFDAGLSVRYAITGVFGAQIGYHYTDVSSDVTAREYSRNRIFAGVNVTF